VPSKLRAGSFDFNDQGWEGTSELVELARARLGRERVELAATLEYGALKPEDGVLLLRPLGKLNPVEIGAFLGQGGRLAVLDDFGAATDLLSRFQIQRLGAPLRPAQSLRNNPNLAIALPTVQNVAGQEQGRHAVVSRVERVVTNHPTALGHPSLTPVLTIPAVDEPDATLAVTGIIGRKGRLFAMGDPSVFINLMLRYPGNRALAEGLVDYLVDQDSWGRGGGKLYILANSFGQHGHYGGGGGVAGDLRDALENLKESVREARERGLSDTAAVLLAALTLGGALWWLGSIATRVYRRPLPRYAFASPLVAQGGVAGRAAVLGAESTPEALAVLELRAALEERLTLRLGLPPGGSPREFIREIDRQGALSRRSSELLTKLLEELGRVADRMSRHQKISLGQAELASIRQRTEALLREMDQSTGRNPG
jgi:hypothetical protein